MSGPQNPIDAMRCDLDDVLVLCNEINDILRAVVTRQVQRARTRPEVEDIIALIDARRLLHRIRETATAHHPDRRPNP